MGRFCYWHDDGESRGPEEPRTIAPFRANLTQRLAEAALLEPGDGWIAGQRVRYLVEAGQLNEALAPSDACRAERWWCAALAGLVSHAAGSHAEADSAFAAALDAMPDDRRCAWEDVSDLLPPRAARAYGRLSCTDRRTWLAPVWRLADPSWARPGNDRRSEHYARQVMSELEREARSTYSMPWGKGVRRFGSTSSRARTSSARRR